MQREIKGDGGFPQQEPSISMNKMICNAVLRRHLAHAAEALGVYGYTAIRIQKLLASLRAVS